MPFTQLIIKVIHPMPQQLTYVIDQRLYLNITDRCTLTCTFCPKTQGQRQIHGYDLTLNQRPEASAIIAAIGDATRYTEVVFCGYGEPTLRLNTLLQVARYIKAQQGRVRVNTDGLANLVHKRDVLPELGTCVDALSVSLNAQNESLYQRYCQPALPGAFPALLEFLRRAPLFIPQVTASAIDGLPDVDIEACAQLASTLGVHFRRRVLDQLG